jgi:hypothetical protein
LKGRSRVNWRIEKVGKKKVKKTWKLGWG